MSSFSVRLPEVGVAAAHGVLRGYVTVARSGALRMRVAIPAGVPGSRIKAFANGRPVPVRIEGGLAVFQLPATANRPANWAVT
jgi:hypothetical protein